MCGICGFTRTGGAKDDEAALRAMRDMAAHRGPDAAGQFLDEKMALGHRRLAVIDLHEEANQPFAYGQEGRYVAVYNGEIYNYIELREELRAKGYIFETECDTEVLAAAYAEFESECVNRFNGMWAFAIYDREKGRLFCARDRYGIKPFYYVENEGEFAFASEIKQLLPRLGGAPKANTEALAAFLVTGQLDGGEETLFRDVWQLAGGHSLEMDLATGDRRIYRWYDLEKVRENPEEYEAAAARFRQDFETAVQLRERSDVPVGYCLSGGLDSSAIVCTSARMKKEQNVPFAQQCISSQSPVAGYDESEFVQAVCETTGAEVSFIRPDVQKLFNDLDKIIWHMDEPFGSTSIFAQWGVFQKAGELGLTVMLDGQGADEQLCGYTVAVSVALCELLRAGKKVQAKAQLAAWREKHPAKGAGVAKRIWWLAQIYRFLPQGFAGLFSQRALLLFGKTPFSRRLKRKGLAASTPSRVRSLREYTFDALHRDLAALLHYEDRNSMAFSIESRVPFLDRQFVETVFSMPAGHKLKEGETKAVMREALVGILPEKVRTRQDKMGFVTPEVEWMKQNPALFRQYLEEACDALAPLVNKKKALAWFDAGKAYSPGEFALWRIICAGRWAKVFETEI